MPRRSDSGDMVTGIYRAVDHHPDGRHDRDGHDESGKKDIADTAFIRCLASLSNRPGVMQRLLLLEIFP
jgi:hypothetical protein